MAVEGGRAGGARRRGPTAARILLGARLRRVREECDISRSRAANAIRASDSKIGRMELGRSPFKERDVADLLTLYRITDEVERRELIGLARESAGPGWWHGYGDLISAGTEHYFGLEEAARLLWTYEPQLVPELLQTSHYARAVTQLRHHRATGTEIDRRVNMRMERQRLFFAAHGQTLWAIMDEVTLRRPWGGPKVLREQLRHLLEVSELPNVVIQIVPFAAVSSIGPGVAFTRFRFGEPEMPDVIHLDQLTGSYYLDKLEDVEEFSMAIALLATTALDPETSHAFLEKVLAHT